MSRREVTETKITCDGCARSTNEYYSCKLGEVDLCDTCLETVANIREDLRAVVLTQDAKTALDAWAQKKQR